MTTVRFSKVVEKCGKPEVFLRLSKNDPKFKAALEAHRIMTLIEGHPGSKADHGEVGHHPNWKGQILIFPKSMAFFTGAKVVGIQHRVFSGESEPVHTRPRPTKGRSGPRKSKKVRTKADSDRNKAEKVIPFPHLASEPPEDDGMDDVKHEIRRALAQLEKGNSVAAYNLLKRIVAS